MNKLVLVVGGAGFVGRAIAEKFIAAGWRTHVLDKLVNPCSVPPKGAAFFKRLPKYEADVVVNAACITQDRTEALPGLGFANNTSLARDIADNAVCSHIIHLSSVSVYGAAGGPAIFETTIPRPLTKYGGQKLAAEAVMHTSNAPASILRLTNVYGPGMQIMSPYCGVAGQLVRAALYEEPFHLTQNGVRTYSFVTDVADYVVRIAEKGPERSLLNVVHPQGTGHTRSVTELAKTIEALTGRTIHVSIEAPRAIDTIQERQVHSFNPVLPDRKMEEGLLELIKYGEGK